MKRDIFVMFIVLAVVSVILIPQTSHSQNEGYPLINEVMTSNITSIMDEYNTSDYNCLGSWCDYLLGLEPFGIAQYDGDYPGWIELYNPGDTTLDLEGYGLSDDPAEPFKWVFPDYTIFSKGYFLVFASGKDRKPAMSSDSAADSGGVFLPHTNFKLGAKSGTVVLTKPDNSIADEMEFKTIPVDFSFGRKPDGTNSWVVFFNPTPRKSNDTESFPGFLDTVTVSQPGGFYTTGPTVSLSALSPEAEIRYTLDGGDPTVTSLLYSTPLTISSSRVLKARAFKHGILSSPVEVRTYMVGYHTTLPVVSLSTAPANLYDGVIGIYTKGTVTGQNNYMRDMERPCHIEYFEPDGTLEFSQDVGIRLNGRSTRDQPRKSLAVMARGKYGDNSIDYQFYPDLPIKKFKSVILRNGGNDLQGSLIRDALSQDIVKNLDIDMMRSKPVVVFLNGG
ncbi:MAG: chitobiase/beta-hexosaminidase C-terminal domain-containing protein, partial [Candidatus Latescibacterota bacterium]